MDDSTKTFDASCSISEFLNATAAKQPAPGGGSVTALVGALSAAIGEMVLNYSAGKKELSSGDNTLLTTALAEMSRAREMMLELMVEDQQAFAALSTARKDKSSADRIAAALLECIQIPQAIAAAATALLQLCGSVAPVANKFLISDLAVCAELAMATVRCAAYNVRINLNDVTDAAQGRQLSQQIDAIVSRATAQIRNVMPAIWKRLET